MIPKVHSGDRPLSRLRDFDKLRETLQSSQLVTSTPGVSLSPTPHGGLFTFIDPKRIRWVYVVGIDEADMIVCKEAVPVPGGDVVYDNNHILVVPMAPGYTIDHFFPFVIEGPQPVATDRACKIEGGRIATDNRMLLVTPVDVDQLCEPCGTQAQAERGLAVGTSATSSAATQADCPGCGGGI